MNMSNAQNSDESLAPLFPLADAIPAAYRLDPRYYERWYLINGEVREWNGPLAEIHSPICLRDGGALRRPMIGHVPAMDEPTAMAALDAAVQAWDEGRGRWPTLTVSARIEAVEAFVSGMLAVRDEVVKLLMWEIGKSLDDSRKEFDRTVEYIRKTIEALKDIDRAGSRFSLDGGVIAQVRRAPLGVVLSMGPFNYPLNEIYTTLIPALIMGNTLVVKTPKFGRLLHQPLLRAFAECFPPGVVNFLSGAGSEIIGPIMKSGRVNALAFIGSSRVADILKHQHPQPHRMRCILGLDAKNPALILPDADLEVTVKECVTGSLSFNGQRCTALKILFVHESIASEFLEKFCAAVNALPLGMPWDKDVKLTPMPEFDKAKSMNGYVENATACGAKVVNAGGGVYLETLYRPAVVYPVAPQADLYFKEQFGPVVPVCVYRDEREFLNYVAQSNFGQQVSLFGRDHERVARLIAPLANQVCRINLNCQCQRGPDTLPFTGRKDSAEATLSISDALRCFSIRSLVAAQANPDSRQLIQDIVSGRHSSFLHTDFLL
ncbi:MAG TPA: NADP-dependent glyceraldehyde-3-phosphate dehydrogenase [Candidatus Paceibacterota bacterium]|nr:NADP-dependent glyceraldehyde-3-phosphate dehydrogenase [Verrucomicrobiota bacterium]HRY48515.1 NADP-dependent glyceraldehyde-3-phosphate dehydrogenase [Candidatus Paceibacterota bacterium]HSA01383.1 NADP-dependent glyceraldehyde-3-phosphate dehydrogenase [Candidatus Paceibacterota bacterium]